MADELINTPAPTPVVEAQAPNPVEARITDLSSKVKTASDERDAATARAEAAEKKAAFAEGFVDIVTANPAAKEHKADIEAKVMEGMKLQDAMYAVLGPAGKLGTPKVDRQPVAGGSASTNISANQGNKELSGMTREELRAAVVEEVRKGTISYN